MAVLTDHEIELARQLHADGKGMGVVELAGKFEVSRGCMSKVLRYITRRP